MNSIICMSQRAVFVEVDGEQYEEIFHSVPDYEECLSICSDMGIENVMNQVLVKLKDNVIRSNILIM